MTDPLNILVTLAISTLILLANLLVYSRFTIIIQVVPISCHFERLLVGLLLIQQFVAILMMDSAVRVTSQQKHAFILPRLVVAINDSGLAKLVGLPRVADGQQP